MSYTLIAESDCIRRDADGALIPDDPANADRRAYEAWLAAGHAPAPPPTPTLAELEAEKLAALAERRRRAETSGIAIDGMRIATDATAQAKLTAAVVASILDDDEAVRWKLADGSFVLFDRARLVAVTRSVRAHVQACFDREAALALQIRAAADAAAIAAIDVDAGWPG